MLPPRKAPKVTAGLQWPPEMLALVATATNKPNACASATAISPAGDVGAFDVSLLYAIVDPCPANTKIKVLMNSANAALNALG